VLGVLAVAIVAAVLWQALTAGAPKRPEPAEPAVATPPARPADPNREAEERLLSETTFLHPVNVAPPEVHLTRADGKPLNLSSLRGKVVFVNFWATWCPPCVEEMPSMLKLGRELSQAHPDKFAMVAVSADDSWEVVNNYFAKSFGGVPRELTLVRDPDARAAHEYYCTARGYCPDVKFPETYILGKDGRMTAMIVGPRNWSDPGAKSFLEFLIKG
jgi:thiol-disulfide isomerase/thioredoxin